jgi:hypothetical protein
MDAVSAILVSRLSPLLQDALLTTATNAAPYASQLLLEVTALLDIANSRGGGAGSAHALTRPTRDATLTATPSASCVQVRGSGSVLAIARFSSRA